MKAPIATAMINKKSVVLGFMKLVYPLAYNGDVAAGQLAVFR
jgi:hypothetical protein